MSSKREQSVLDGRTKLLDIFLLCMTVSVESAIKQRAKCTRWQDKIIGYISLVHDIFVESVIKESAKCTRWQGKNWLYFSCA